jgi:predicted dehydrogenase
MGKIKIGIVGTGYTIGIARAHIHAYKALEDTEITAIYDINPAFAERYKTEQNLSTAAVCGSLDELIGKVDALSICTPNNRHMEIAKAALDAGKHFICEKPLATSYEEGKKFVDYMQGHFNKVVAMMGFHLRDMPMIRYIKQIINEGKIGRIYSIVQQTGGSRIADPFNVKREWRMDKEQSGDGALPDFGSHLLDLADYILSDGNGKMCKVQGFKNTFISERPEINGTGNLPVTNDDTIVFNTVTDKGALCSFYVSRIGVPFQTMQITGDGGVLYYNSKDPTKLGVQLKDQKGSYTSPLEFRDIPAECSGKEGHKGLIAEFINAIKTGAPYTRGIDHGLYIQYLLSKINEAAETGKSISV